ncbi:MAG: hypothetical protein ACR2LE_04950 [Nocardioidaceae bacterium]
MTPSGPGLAATGAAVAALAVLGTGQAIVAGAAAGPAATDAAAASAAPGDFCTTDEGVTLVVDMTAFGDGIVVRCVEGPLGSGVTGWEALQQAGFSPQSTAGQGGFVCRLAGEPSASRSLAIPGDDDYHEQCQRTPPQSAYWAYSYAENGGHWTYSTIGAASRAVVEGGFEGWVFALNGSRTTPALAPFHPHTTTPTVSDRPTAQPTAPAPPERTTSGHTTTPQHGQGDRTGQSPTTSPSPAPRTSSSSDPSGPTTAPATTSVEHSASPSLPSSATSKVDDHSAGGPTTHSRVHQPNAGHHGDRSAARSGRSADPQSTGETVVTSDLPAAAADDTSAGSAAPLVLGLVVLAALGLGAGVTVWRRSHSG